MSIRLRMNIKEGPARGLCGKCQNAIIRQEETGEPFVSCGAYYPPRDIVRNVVSCTGFDERGQNTVDEMKKIAWILEVKKGRIMGFKTPDEVKTVRVVDNE